MNTCNRHYRGFLNKFCYRERSDGSKISAFKQYVYHRCRQCKYPVFKEKSTKNLISNAEEARPVSDAYQKLESYLDNLKCKKGHLSAQEPEETLICLTRTVGQASMVV
jgi:hypothetical protein